jgi:hypothetical protein
MYEWILIIILNSNQTVRTVTFNEKKSCEIAAKYITDHTHGMKNVIKCFRK